MEVAPATPPATGASAAASAPVWVEITDPESHNTFYANLKTGECDWTLPEGATIQPPNADGEWWELFDDVHNLPYYYNTKSGQTEWERPLNEASIIPLMSIQKSVIGQRLSVHLSNASFANDPMRSPIKSDEVASAEMAAAIAVAGPTLESRSSMGGQLASNATPDQQPPQLDGPALAMPQAQLTQVTILTDFVSDMEQDEDHEHLQEPPAAKAVSNSSNHNNSSSSNINNINTSSSSSSIFSIIASISRSSTLDKLPASNGDPAKGPSATKSPSSSAILTALQVADLPVSTAKPTNGSAASPTKTSPVVSTTSPLALPASQPISPSSMTSSQPGLPSRPQSPITPSSVKSITPPPLVIATTTIPVAAIIPASPTTTTTAAGSVWKNGPLPKKASKSNQSMGSSFVSSFQRAASMTLSRNSMVISSPIPVQDSATSRPKSTVLSTNGNNVSHSNGKQSTASTASQSHQLSNSNDKLQPARKSFQIAERARKFGIGAPIANDEAARQMSPMILEQQQEALRKMAVSPPPASRKMSMSGDHQSKSPGSNNGASSSTSPKQQQRQQNSLPHPTLPAELQSSISQFRIAGFAQKYFSTHKKGLFRRKVPVEKMLLHQKNPLSQPLMVLNKRGVQKDALRCFKIIQKLMGERKGNGYVGPTGIPLGETCLDLSIQSDEDIKLLLELIKKGLDHGELRDEIYVQLCKQLTSNPSRESNIKGWHLFTILLITFSPSKNLQDYLASFLSQHANNSAHPIPVMAQHCNDLLRRITKRGSRAKVLTMVEIARAQEAAFRPSVFEATLERLMGRQMAAGGIWASWRVPRLMVFLKESVISLGGRTTEGIFRISGDLGSVAELRARIELGNYDITGISDPNVPCSLLRLWIRDLPEPVIPYEMYQRCIQAAQDIDQVAVILNELPLWHREMIIYLIAFLKTFNNDKVREDTKMNLSNLAMVFAPTLLQCPSEDTPMLIGHLQAERAFVSTLIADLELGEDDLRLLGDNLTSMTV